MMKPVRSMAMGAMHALPAEMKAGSGRGSEKEVIPSITPAKEERFMGFPHFLRGLIPSEAGISQDMPMLFRNRLIGRVNMR